jgi:hypothetical protein
MTQRKGHSWNEWDYENRRTLVWVMMLTSGFVSFVSCLDACLDAVGVRPPLESRFPRLPQCFQAKDIITMSFQIFNHSPFIITFPPHSALYNLCGSNSVVKQAKNKSMEQLVMMAVGSDVGQTVKETFPQRKPCCRTVFLNHRALVL